MSDHIHVDPDCRAGAGSHPDQPRPEITEMDYGMQGGALHMSEYCHGGLHPAQMEWTAPPDYCACARSTGFVRCCLQR